MRHPETHHKRNGDLKQVVSDKKARDRFYQNGLHHHSSKPKHRSPSPTSSDSDIQFTRRGGLSRGWCTCVIVAAICVGLGAAAGIYFGYQFLRVQEPPMEKVFRGKFRISRGDPFIPALADPATPEFQRVAANYRDRLDMIFKKSVIKTSYMGTDILALDGTEGMDLIVYFNIHMDTRKVELEPAALYVILAEEMEKEEKGAFLGLTVEVASLEVQERKVALVPDVPRIIDKADRGMEDARVSADIRSCVGVEIPFCNRLPYNLTSYPNLLGHKVKADVVRDLVAFREIVDSECYSLAYEFVCQLLQPACYRGAVVLPCRDFCTEFLRNCGSRVPERLKKKLRCQTFPDSEQGTSCISKPGCVTELQARGRQDRICDGVMDCEDFSDELECDYCPPGHFHCGVSQCVSNFRRCDGHIDCPNGADERGCLTVAPNLEAASFSHQYFGKGIISVNQGGVLGKMCADINNSTISRGQKEALFRRIGDWICTLLTYKSSTSVDVVPDRFPHENVYLHLSDSRLPKLKFTKSPCKTKQVVQVECGELECGLTPSQTSRDTETRSGPSPTGARLALHGDWPWQAVLYKEEHHMCDGTLVAGQWVLTTAGCFQGQAKAAWTARFSSVRLSSVSPWEQQRRVIGMVKSPLENSNVVLIKLHSPVIFSDYVRPVCLGTGVTPRDSCLTLGWGPHRDQLQELELRESSMEDCKNISITGYHSICMQRASKYRPCMGEEMAGAPLLCQSPESDSWRLEGVSSWRVTCSEHTKRPRLYDKTEQNSDWIIKTISTV